MVAGCNKSPQETDALRVRKAGCIARFENSRGKFIAGFTSKPWLVIPA